MRCKKCSLKSRLPQWLLLILLFLNFLIFSGCVPLSELLFGPSGSIEVVSYPAGAKIFFNDKDTGYFTPYTFTNLPKREYNVKVIFGDKSYTKEVIVYAEHTSRDSFRN